MHMTARKALTILVVLCLPVAGHAQQNEAAAPLQIRAVLHDPVNPTAELFLRDQTGSVVRLKLVAEGLSEEQATLPANGSLVLYSSATVDPKKPEASLAASVRIPPNTKRAIVLVLPGPADTKPAYRMVLINDSTAAFPKGESRVISLVPVETAIEAGEHKLPVPAGKVTHVPAVKKVNDFNMAQTNFYYKDGSAWVPFTERQLQYLDEFRRIFIIHVTPGSTQPAVTTIIDTTPLAPPK
jgi:hypothetical protein